MTPALREFLSEWHRVVSEKDLDALWEVLADDVSLGAPPYWDRFQGRRMPAAIAIAAAKVSTDLIRSSPGCRSSLLSHTVLFMVVWPRLAVRRSHHS